MPNAAVSHDVNDYRVVVFGSAGVGKSSIVQRFVHGSFKEGYVPTIEDTYRKVCFSPVNFVNLFYTSRFRP